MLFNSSLFICYFIMICILYYLIPSRGKKGYLLIVSYVFYAFWNPLFLILLVAITAGTWLGAFLIQKNKKAAQLAILVVAVFLPLFFFKYYHFTLYLMETLFGLFGKNVNFHKPDLVMPVGISFFTFQAVGYLIDVWREKVPVEKNFFSYALFLSFFPQQAAGPIGRAGQLLPQINKPRRFQYEQVLAGITYMLYGYFQKVLVADTIGAVVDGIYGSFREHNSVTLLLTTFLYSIEIYCDFAGYSNLALGAGKVLGFDLIQNFQAPYLALSVAEFWRRWHISLTTWFRDYLYFPLGGSRKGKLRQYLNIMIVFLVSGLWHGASLHYVVWGGINGAYQIIGRSLQPVRDQVCRWFDIDRNRFSHRLFKRITTFLLINFSWVFFRVEGTKESLYFFQSMLYNRNMNIQEMNDCFLPGTIPQIRILLLLSILVVFFVDLYVYSEKKLAEGLVRQGAWLKILVYLILIFVVIIFGHYGSEFDASQFIYLQY